MVISESFRLSYNKFDPCIGGETERSWTLSDAKLLSNFGANGRRSCMNDQRMRTRFTVTTF